MGLYINTNASALGAQRRLNTTTGSLSQSFERLSSGLRINGAKDDAAGLSITTRFSSQIRGLNQAVRNSNDGISLAQTAEGALNETTNILQRIRELSVQSANDTNNSSDRASIQAEVSQLIEEVDRIADTTNFNGNKVLNGDFLGKTIQVGANVGETLNVNVSAAGSSDLARQARYDSTVAVNATALATGGVTIQKAGAASAVNVRGTVAADDTVSTVSNSGSAIAKAAAINDLTDQTGVRAVVNQSQVTLGTATGGTLGGALDGSNYITVNDQKISGFTVQTNDADGTLVDAINAVSDKTGVVASLNENSRLVLTAADGRNIEVQTTGTVAGVGATVGSGTLTLQSAGQFDLGGANAGTQIGHSSGIFGVNSTHAVKQIDVSTRAGAVVAIDTVDLALEQVSSSRANLGALQNRLESTINNLSTTSENLSASRSRILDADFAAETAQLSRNQIIQQAGVSILAQANQQPQVALALLG